MINFTVKNFKYGTINKLEQQSIPAGAASASLNWITRGDKIELRRGYRLMGATEESGVSRVTGLGMANVIDGTQIPYKSAGRKVKYYDVAAGDWIEVSSDILAAEAIGEDVSFANYNPLAGAQLWFASPNSSLFKVMTANPGSAVDQYNSAKNYKGRIAIKQNRMMLWHRNQDKTAAYLSYIDGQVYTTVSAEVLGTGNGSNKVFAGTLAFKASGAKRTCFGISVSDGVETFTDNYDGTLTGSAGGSGTINYATGAISVTFNATVTNLTNVTVSYQWEDSTNHGIADFTHSGTRLAGEGVTFRQDDGGGDLENVGSYEGVEYCFHRYKTWELTLSNDDTNATNLIYRQLVGIPYYRAMVPTGDGIYFVDVKEENNPQVRLLRLNSNSTKVIPPSISPNLDLSGYRFDLSAGKEFEDFIVFSCRTTNSEVNNRILIYNKIWNSFDIIDYYSSVLETYNGALLGGDSLSANVYEFFSGFDDDDSLINNYWESHISNLSVDELKKSRRFVVEGEIGPDQQIDVYLDYDRSGYVLVGSILGSGEYVDKGQAVYVGAETLGRPEVGGGSGGVEAYHFTREFKLDTSKFYEAKVKFQAVNIGWAAISMYKFQDIIRKNTKIAKKYRV